MSKEPSPGIQAGCRVAGYISDAAKKKNIAEVFDVLQVMSDGLFRCHMVGTRFDVDNRHVLVHEYQLVWCRLPDGREFARKSSEENWQDAKLLT